MTGKILERDEQGRIKKKILTSEEARTLGRISAEARSGGGSTVENLLNEQGYGEDNIAPEYIRIMALQAVKSPSAMAHWRRVHTTGDIGTMAPNALELHGKYMRPEPGERCPWCGTFNFNPTSEEIDTLVEYLVAHRAVE